MVQVLRLLGVIETSYTETGDKGKPRRLPYILATNRISLREAKSQAFVTAQSQDYNQAHQQALRESCRTLVGIIDVRDVLRSKAWQRVDVNTPR